MADMSNAIRTAIEDHSGARTLRDIPQDDLVEYATIVQAFGADLHDELTRRRTEAAA